MIGRGASLRMTLFCRIRYPAMDGELRTSASSTAMTTPPNADWPKGVGAPAIRALTAAGYTGLRQLAGVPAGDLRRLHGMGPKALSRLQEALEEQGLSLG
jgi:hypothetical protein